MVINEKRQLLLTIAFQQLGTEIKTKSRHSKFILWTAYKNILLSAFTTWRVHLFILSRENKPKFPNTYSVIKMDCGDVFSLGKYSADLSSPRSLWSRAGGRQGCPLPSTARRDQLSQMQAGEQRAGFMGPASHRPLCRGSSIPMPITWSLGHKSLLIILILMINLK